MDHDRFLRRRRRRRRRRLRIDDEVVASGDGLSSATNRYILKQYELIHVGHDLHQEGGFSSSSSATLGISRTGGASTARLCTCLPSFFWSRQAQNESVFGDMKTSKARACRGVDRESARGTILFDGLVDVASCPKRLHELSFNGLADVPSCPKRLHVPAHCSDHSSAVNSGRPPNAWRGTSNDGFFGVVRSIQAKESKPDLYSPGWLVANGK
jgi:hypothetical protein